MHKMPRRIELAKHAILDRLEDANCARNKRSVQTGELAALRNAHRSLRVLEQLYFDGNSGKGNSGARWLLKSQCRSRAGLCLAILLTSGSSRSASPPQDFPDNAPI
jgi:hypothetical protein